MMAVLLAHSPVPVLCRLLLLVSASSLLWSRAEAAPALVLVSHAANGAATYGPADTGLVPGYQGVSRPQPFDDGTVLFLSVASLVPNLTFPGYWNPYHYAANGTVAVVAEPPVVPGLGVTLYSNAVSCRASADGTLGFLLRLKQQTGAPEYHCSSLTLQAAFGSSFAALPNSSTSVVALGFAGHTAVYIQTSVAGVSVLDFPLTGGSGSWSSIPDSNQGTAASPSVSADGQRLVFATDAALLPEDVDAVSDAYLYDRSLPPDQQLSCPTLAIRNPCSSPVIAGNGSVIAFLQAGQIYTLNLASGLTEKVSIAANGAEANSACADPRLSADGRFVAYLSAATNLVSGLTVSQAQLFLYDRETQQVSCLSADGTAGANSPCLSPDLAPSGRYATFVTKATNLVAGATGSTGYYQVYRADRGSDYRNHPPQVVAPPATAQSGQPVPLNITVTDTDNDTSLSVRAVSLPSVGAVTSADGSGVVAGAWYATTTLPWTYTPPAGADSYQVTLPLVANDGRAESQVAVMEITGHPAGAGYITLVSTNDAGEQGNDHSGKDYPRNVSISSSGQQVTFFSAATDLAGAGQMPVGPLNVYFRDRTPGVTRTFCLSDDPADLAPTQHLHSQVSGNGAYVAYNCQVSGLFRYHIATRTRELVDSTVTSVNSLQFAISGDGTRILYLKANGTQVWLWERRTTSPATVRQISTTGMASCRSPALSADSDVAVFIANDTIYWKSLEDDEAPLAVSSDHAGNAITNLTAASLSATGRYVLFPSSATGSTKLYLKNVGSGTATELSSAAGAGLPALTSNGRYAVYIRADQCYRYDIGTGTEQLASHIPTNGGTGGNGVCYSGAISATGRYVAFSSAASDLLLDNADANGKVDVFVNDLGEPSNTAPVPTGTACILDEDSSVDIPLEFADAEGDDVKVEIVALPSHAVTARLLRNGPGRTFSLLRYTPAPDFTGTDSFSYRCRDAAATSGIQTVTVTVQNVNDPPTLAAVADQTVQEGQLLTVPLTWHDPDLANPLPDTHAFEITGPGSVTDGVYSWTPSYNTVAPPAATGTETVTVTVRDAAGAAAAVTFFVTVTPVPRTIQLTPTRLLLTTAESGRTLSAADLGYGYTGQATGDLDPTALLLFTGVPTGWSLTTAALQPVTVAGGHATLNATDLPLTLQTGNSYADSPLTVQATNGDGASVGPLALRIITGAYLHPLHLEKGWNAISFPMLPADATPTALVQECLPNSGVLATFWQWSSAQRRFELCQTLAAGMGYWIYSPAVVNVDVPGAPLLPADWGLASGWNLLGPVGAVAPAAMPAGVTAAWQYETRLGTYRLLPGTDMLSTGTAYFLLAP